MSGGDTTKTVDTSSSTKYDPWVTDASKGIYSNASSLVGSNPTYKPYEGDRTANFGSSWDASKQWLTQMLGASNPDIDAARSGINNVMGASDASKTTADYMNPFLDATLAPTLRKITEGYDTDRAQLGGSAASAGAFGDSGFGVQQALLARNKNNSIGEATGTATAKAYDAANAERNTTLQRIMSGAQAQAALGNQQFQQNASTAGTLGGMGAAEQGVEQKGIDSQIADSKTAQTFGLDQLSKLTLLLKGLPNNISQTGTQTTTAPDNTGMALLGSLLGGIAGNPAIV